MSKRFALLAALAALTAACLAPQASSSRFLKVGLFDEAQTLYGNPDRAFPVLEQLGAQMLRVNLYWGGSRYGVARRRPQAASNPDDPAYNWGLYDRTVLYAAEHGIKVVFSIYRTPTWAGGGSLGNRAPRVPADLQRFANAAAKRYSGTWERKSDDRVLPAVRHWLAWNEPNNPNFISPQFRLVGGRFVPSSPAEYAKICNAIYAGVHATLLANQKVACGVTGPRGNNSAQNSRPSLSPLVFLRGMKAAGIRRFDAYAHHPYYGKPTETPTTRLRATTAITLGNIDVLIKELTRLYGSKRVWITEYGYQTRPEDQSLGVSWNLQARYLTQAYAMARSNPRIDMMLWFLLRDEPRLLGHDGWQSGFITIGGRRKPAFAAFQRFARTLSGR